MPIKHIIQAVILIGAGWAWWLLPKREANKRRWGFVIILCTQPLWFYMSWQNGQWAVALISIWYGINAIRGIRSHFGGGHDQDG